MLSPRFKLLSPLLVAAVVLLAGCGERRERNQITEADMRAFANAPAEIKALWDKAKAADQGRDFLTAQTTLRQLEALKLTPEQSAGVINAMKADTDKMLDAVNKGDPAAVKAMEAVRQIDLQRRR